MSEFSFIRPALLLLLIPVLMLFVWLTRQHVSAGWSRYIDADKLRWLMMAGRQRRYGPWLWLASAIVAVTALAGPSWQVLPEASMKNRHGMVFAFDLSDSMLAYDLSPSRLARARLKLIDLLEMRRDGETALIAYANQAFQVAPLTDDPKTIISLVPTLHPNIMPAPGSHTEAAVSLAIQTLQDAGLSGGDIVLVTDGIAPQARQSIIESTPPQFRVSILGVGTPSPVQVPNADGGLLRDAQGQPITQTMDPSALSTLSGALGGIYTSITDDNTDIDALAALNQATQLVSATTRQSQFDVRRDGGWLLALLLLPVVLYMFRRNLLWMLVLFLPINEPAMATDFVSLWRTADQQAMHALKNGNARLAATLFKNPRWAAVARYRAGQFAAAAKTKIPNPNPDDLYNRANALVMTGALPEAIAIYDQVLKRVPNHHDAKFNRKITEQTWQRIQQERAAQLERQKRLVGDETEASDQGDEQAPPGPSSQANQVGGASSDTQNNEQGALRDQGSSNQRSSENEQNQNNPQQPATTRDQATRDSAKPRPSKNAPLNPYAEQWLRNLQNDPGALMRRKFQFQANQRAREGAISSVERRY